MDKKINVNEILGKGKLPSIWLKRLSFTSILVSSNLLQTMFTKTLQDGLTSKQWLLLTVVSSIDEDPTLTEIASFMGCSRQNIKQIANILNKKGYLEFTKAQSDKNALRLRATEKWDQYLSKYAEGNEEILHKIFKDFDEKELESFYKSFDKIIRSIEEINEEL